MPNMKACAGDDIGFPCAALITIHIWAGNYMNIALLTNGSAELQQIATGSSFVLNERGEL